MALKASGTPPPEAFGAEDPLAAADTVVEIVAGLWRIPVAIPLPGLQSVSVYAFDVGDGLMLVDAGWSSAESLASLEAGLAAIGAGLADVRGVAFTHAHGDHYGLAGSVRERSGAWLALHEDELPVVEARLAGGKRFDADLGEWLSLAGVADRREQETMKPRSGPAQWDLPIALPDRRLSGGERLEAPGWELTVLHTPGHAPGHVVFVEQRSRLVLTGDAILPRITPNISASPYARDPLGDYFSSLARVQALGDLLGLPGHGPPLLSVAARAREIRDHHETQLGETRALVEGGAETVREVAERMTWARPWASLAGYDRRAALGEAQAHLVALEMRGSVERTGALPLRWRSAVGASRPGAKP